MEKSKDKYDKIVRELERQLEFSIERRKVVAEEKADVEFHHKRLRRQYLEESAEHRIALEELARLDEKLQTARQDLALKRALFTQEERERESLGQELFSAITHIEQHQTLDLTEPDKLRLEKQIEGFKHQINQEKAKVRAIRNKTADIEGEMEGVQFTIKTLKQDLVRARLAAKRVEKTNAEIRALQSKKTDSDEERENDLLLSSDEDEKASKRKRRQRLKPTTTKRTERRIIY